MGEWKNYIIYYFGVQVAHKVARSKKEACNLYVEEWEKRYIMHYGRAPTQSKIKDVYENIEVFEKKTQ